MVIPYSKSRRKFLGLGISALGLFSLDFLLNACTPLPNSNLIFPPTSTPNVLKVVFHKDYLKVYSDEAAAAPGRIESILKEIQGVPDFTFVQPSPASEDDLRMVHTQRLIDSIKVNPQLYYVACLAAGGAILASDLAMGGEVPFGLIRPPGHHASSDTYSGFCYFNNIAIAIRKLLYEKKIERALIVDFDLHFGNGTHDIFLNDSRVTYYHLDNGDRYVQLHALEEFLSQKAGYDILAVSAGFDKGKEDWGKVFEIQDYTTIGTLLKNAAERNTGNKRFAVLEGGYNQEVLGKNVNAFLKGFK